MLWYASPIEEVRAVRRAAARTSCALESLSVAPATMGAPPRVVSSLSCPDGWAAARFLLALAAEDAKAPGALELAADLRAGAVTDADFARAIHSFVRSRVAFEREDVETFESPGYTLAAGHGDCDAHFRLVYAIAVAGGLPAALGILHHGHHAPIDKRGPAHALALLELGGEWVWSETTIAAELGEDPNAAAARLGITNERSDIAKEVTVMTEQDLPPVPVGYLARNSAARVLLDAEALQRLGYLADDVPSCALADPTSTPLRLAVLAFQRDQGLPTLDGLLGDKETRPALVRALRKVGPPITEGFGYPGIGDLDAAPAVAKHSAHLSDNFLRMVRAMVDRWRALGATVTAEDMLLVWLAESGIRNIPNHQGAPFGGLNQMGPDERRAAGFMGTFAEWLAMPLETQLPFVDRFYVMNAAGKFTRYRDAASMYLVNFAPAFIAHAGEPEFIIFRRNASGPLPTAPEAEWAAWRNAHRSDPYAWNRGFDRRKDGTIRVGDLRVALDGAARSSPAYWAEVQARIGASTGAPSSPPATSAAGVLVLVSAGLATAAAGAAWYFT